jgi:hypothetical protein
MRKWLALIAVCGALVVSGVAFGLTGADTPPTTTDAEDEVGDDPDVVAVKKAHEENWDLHEAYRLDEPKTAEEPSEPPADVPEPDTTPPEFQILHPVDGQVFESKEVVFEGTTEPGSRVFAGEYEADVNDSGGWRIVLFLSPGTNIATLRAEDEAGNVSEDSVTIVFERVEEPKDQDEPRHEDGPKEEEEPKHEDGPKEEEEPKEEQVWEFSAKQVYGECSESPPYDVFHGTGKPGSVIRILSEYGSGEAVVNEEGGWESKVYFEGAPVGKGILVKVVDEFDHMKTFEFTHTA